MFNLKTDTIIPLVAALVLVGASALNAQSERLPKPATKHTEAYNAQVISELPFDNRTDYRNATKGLIKRFDGVIPSPDPDSSGVVWNLSAYDFLNNTKPTNAPSTVNPSLWRQAQLNNIAGLFKVHDRIYQLRGFDLAVMSLIKGDSGWIVIDPLTTTQAADFAFDFAMDNLEDNLDGKVSAIVFTHSHIDHYGGALGITSKEAVENGEVQVIAPEAFFEHSVSENIIAGNVMGRRASYMYGLTMLKRGPRSQVDAGLGKATSNGDSELILPTVTISSGFDSPKTLPVDGVNIVFWNTPDAEAPAEMMFYFPQFKALCTAEELTHTMHNTYSLRGTKVRDALAWSSYLSQALERYGHEAEIMFASHHWPTWGNDEVYDLLAKQRDLYKYLHDQTLRLANQGYTMIEIAERVRLPKSLADEFANRDYYGTLNHNVKATYQRYLGWFDGNPANLHTLTPVEAGIKYVDALGGAKRILRKAKKAFRRGEYRWVAMLLNHVVFAEPDNMDARFLLADAHEQLGYQAESAPWRNFYLTAARELRDPNRAKRLEVTGEIFPSDEELAALDNDDYFEFLAIHLNGPLADGMVFGFNLRLLNPRTQTGDDDIKAVIRIENAVLHAEVTDEEDPDLLSVTMADSLLNRIMKDGGKVGIGMFRESLESQPQTTSLEGSKRQRVQWYEFLTMIDRFPTWFNIIEP